jgi:DNA polymerase (family X)
LNNYEIAKILHEIAIFEEMKGEKFKPRAYEKAALYIGSLSDDLATIYKKGGNSSLMELPGIGKSIAEKLSELIRTGKLQYYADLKREIPVDVAALASIEGIGAKTMKVLYEELGITNIEQLEAKGHRIRDLPVTEALSYTDVNRDMNSSGMSVCMIAVLFRVDMG